MQYLVLGMHKSGTTMVSRLLHESGIEMGSFDSSVSYDQGNQFERAGVQELNELILGVRPGLQSIDIYKPVQSAARDIQEKLKSFIESAGLSGSEVGFKEPRTCLTYCCWLKELPDVKIIVVYRSPISIWHHYRKYIPKWKVFSRFFSGYKALRAWYSYNYEIKQLDGKANVVFFNYNDILCSQGEFERLQAFIGKPLIDIRNSSLSRSGENRQLSYRVARSFLKLFFGKDVESLYQSMMTLR